MKTHLAVYAEGLFDLTGGGGGGQNLFKGGANAPSPQLPSARMHSEGTTVVLSVCPCPNSLVVRYSFYKQHSVPNEG